MTSEQQYYQAKIFLSAYRDALNTLDQVAEERNSVKKCHAYEKYLLQAANKGTIHVEGNHIKEGTYFGESRIRKLGLFTKSLFAEKFPTFDRVSNYSELKTALETYA